jgi:hypothetical protein
MRRKRRKLNPGFVLVVLTAAAVLLWGILAIGNRISQGAADPSESLCRAELTLEAGQPAPSAQDFFLVPAEGATLSISGFQVGVPGSYDVELRFQEQVYTSRLVIVDTVAPQAQAKSVCLTEAGKVQPEDFVSDIVDATKVTVTFKAEPDWSKAGEQTVVVILTDAAGNKTEISSSLLADSEAPVITGAKNLEAYVDSTVSYKKGISVTDNVDSKVTLEIDNSAVDLSKPGVYDITYKATDAAGNSTSVTVQLTVRKKPDNFVDPEVIYARVDAILAKFIREDMTDREKAEAIYVWSRRDTGHLVYGSAPHRDDYLQTANEFLNVRKGDCYYFFAIQKLMFERLGIPTIDVKKVKNFEGDSNHYWLLVSVDGGKTYYHYDNVWSKNLCLVTDEALNNFSDVVDSHPFNRDESLYPATPTQALPESSMPWGDPAILGATP